MEGFETIIFEKKGQLALITLNRPRVLNIYNVRMRDELYEVLSAIESDSDVHVAIIRGAGEKAFCAGADLSEFLSAPAPTFARHVRWHRDVWGLFLNLPQPVIGALHGYVFGSGIEMAMCCDIRIASEDAVFGLPEVALGFIPAAGATQTVPRAVGPGHALDLLLTGRRVGAQEALAMRLVNRVVPRNDLQVEAEKLAEKIAGYDQGAVRKLKQAVSRGLDLPVGSHP
ncbi:MAG: enoyl-CoA hydratase/isomerase family protein [Dehalococcoidia bacterium]|nr:enoyl-CoA hydratase/isomerase family protein [Dehalococcoidia bacterium]